jgi:hypothetical protein
MEVTLRPGLILPEVSSESMPSYQKPGTQFVMGPYTRTLGLRLLMIWTATEVP